MKVNVSFLEVKNGEIIDAVDGYVVLRAGRVMSVVPERGLGDKTFQKELKEYVSSEIEEMIVYPNTMDRLKYGIDFYWSRMEDDIFLDYFWAGMMKDKADDEEYENCYMNLIYRVIELENRARRTPSSYERKQCRAVIQKTYDVFMLAFKRNTRNFEHFFLKDTKCMLEQNSLSVDKETLVTFWYDRRSKIMCGVI